MLDAPIPPPIESEDEYRTNAPRMREREFEPQRRGRPRKTDEQRKAADAARLKRQHQGKATELAWQTSREEAEAGRHFAVKDRFDLSALASSRLPDLLEAPRPVDWLQGFRCDPAPAADGGQSRVLTAGDQLVLEILVAAARTTHLALEVSIHSVPISAIFAIAGPHPQLWIERAMNRLSTTECVLPPLRQPHRRITRRRRREGAELLERIEAEKKDATGITGVEPSGHRDEAVLQVEESADEEEDDGLTQRSYPILDHAALREEYLAEYRMREVADLLRPDIRRGSIPPRPENRQGTALPRRGDPVLYDHPPRPRPDTWLYHRHPPERTFDWWDAKPHIERRFTPVVRWLIDGDTVYFELARWLRHYLNAFRKLDHVRAPWATIDLRQIAGFQSPYTAPLYRYLVGCTYNPAERNVVLDDVDVTLRLEKLAEIVGYRRQEGGLSSQLERAVLRKVAADFERMGGRIRIERTVAPDNSVASFRIHVPVDVHRLRSAHSWKLASGQEVKPSQDDLKRLAPFDAGWLHVPVIAWLKILNRLRLDRDGIMRMAAAWRLVLDDALLAEPTMYGNFRGGHLLDLIRDEGPAAAAFRFCRDEHRTPQLSIQSVLDMYEARGTTAYADLDRVTRYHRDENGYGDLPPLRCERPERSADEIEAARERIRAEREGASMTATIAREDTEAERARWFRAQKRTRKVLDGSMKLDDLVADGGDLFWVHDEVRDDYPIELKPLRRQAREDRNPALVTVDDMRAYGRFMYDELGVDVEVVWRSGDGA